MIVQPIFGSRLPTPPPTIPLGQVWLCNENIYATANAVFSSSPQAHNGPFDRAAEGEGRLCHSRSPNGTQAHRKSTWPTAASGRRGPTQAHCHHPLPATTHRLPPPFPCQNPQQPLIESRASRGWA